jgi:hypothetical protein
MTGEAKKAAPREKAIKFAPTRYRVLEKSYINGALKDPGEEVYLPVGVKAGSNLEPIGGAAAGDDDAPTQGDQAAAFLARSIPLIVDDLGAATDDELDEFLNAERGDKGRVGVIEAIEKEKAAREQAE